MVRYTYLNNGKYGRARSVVETNAVNPPYGRDTVELVAFKEAQKELGDKATREDLIHKVYVALGGAFKTEEIELPKPEKKTKAKTTKKTTKKRSRSKKSK